MLDGPGAEVANSCESPDVVLGTELGPLEEQHMYLTAEPPLQLLQRDFDDSSGSGSVILTSVHTHDKQDHQEEGTPIQNCSSDLLAPLSLIEQCLCIFFPSIVSLRFGLDKQMIN